MELETHQTQVDGTQQALTDAHAAFSSQQTDLTDERGRLQAEIAKLDEQRKDKAASIAADSLTAYEQLRRRFRGQAVAMLQPDGCSMCGVEQTSMNTQIVRNWRTLAYCESCGRILANGT